MNLRNRRTAIAAGCGMVFLILDGKTALDGAVEGINLCLNTLIPSLYPFILLSILLTGALTGQAVPFLRPAASLCKIPKGTESLLVMGFFGGYPVGARSTAQMYRTGQLSRIHAARMICICNNAGPSFIFGILGSMFSRAFVPWVLWAIHIFSALLTGIALPGDSIRTTVTPASGQTRLTEALEQAVKVMASLCGWVVLMRMVLAFLDRWILWMLPPAVQIGLSGILELANGCVRLQQIDSEALRFIIASGMLSFGGICVMFQTASVSDGIPMTLYFPGKLLNCSISILISAFAVPFCFPGQPVHYTFAAFAAVLGGICLCAFFFSKKSSRIPAVIGV